MLPSLKTDQS